MFLNLFRIRVKGKTVLRINLFFFYQIVSFVYFASVKYIPTIKYLSRCICKRPTKIWMDLKYFVPNDQWSVKSKVVRLYPDTHQWFFKIIYLLQSNYQRQKQSTKISSDDHHTQNFSTVLNHIRVLLRPRRGSIQTFSNQLILK